VSPSALSVGARPALLQRGHHLVGAEAVTRRLAGGGVGGGVLLAIIGAIRKAMSKPS